ncbi:MAG: tetratricopeptide repeat protein [Acidobacteria bacterium]|nr:tetratricopeptide repeat protein [Acidobacteriota bacterium]
MTRGSPFARSEARTVAVEERVDIDTVAPGARACWPAFAVLLALLPGCAAPPTDSGGEATAAPTTDIPRIPNLSELDPGFATAVRDALAVVDRDPSRGAAVGALGRLYQAHRYVDQARRCYERAEELEPSSPDWPYYLGFLAAGRGAHEEAARRFERALELRPSYWAARVRLGNALLAAGETDGAEDEFRAVRAASPGTPWGELGLGKASRRRGQPEVAAEHLRAALALDPAHRETRYLLAMTERQLGNPERSEELLAGLADAEVPSLDDPMLKAVFALVRDTQTMIRTANQRLAEGDHLAAERLYREVLRLDPGSYDAHLNLGVLHGLADRNREAAAALERAVEIEPDRADAYALLTIAYIRTGRAEEGLRQLEKALELDPDHPRAREILRSLGGDAAGTR